MELVQEIHQVLMDREDTCIRTCFSLQLDGVTLDNFAELKSIEGLKEGTVIKVVEGMEFRKNVLLVKRSLFQTQLWHYDFQIMLGQIQSMQKTSDTVRPARIFCMD